MKCNRRLSQVTVWDGIRCKDLATVCWIPVVVQVSLMKIYRMGCVRALVMGLVARCLVAPATGAFLLLEPVLCPFGLVPAGSCGVTPIGQSTPGSAMLGWVQGTALTQWGLRVSLEWAGNSKRGGLEARGGHGLAKIPHGSGDGGG